MAFNGSGVFVRLYNWVTDKTNLVNITASRMDAEMDGMASGLSNCVTRDGQGVMGTDFLPGTDNGYSLGNGGLRWLNINGIPTRQMQYRQANRLTTVARSNTTTAADDGQLVASLDIGTWRVEALIFFNAIAGGATPGFKAGFHFSGTLASATFTGSGSANLVSFNPYVATMAGANQSSVNTFSAAASPNIDCLKLEGLFNVTVAGSLAISWAQFQTSGNASQLLINSYITARPLV